MVPVRADYGSEYSQEAVRSESAASVRPPLVLCDVSRSSAKASRTPRRSSHGWQRSLLGLAVVSAILFLLCTCVSALWHASVVAYSRAMDRPSSIISVHVAKGDTLWQYAARYGDPGSYMPDRVQAIADENHLSLASPLSPGQTLRISVQNPVELARLNQSSHSRMASAVVR